MSQRIYSSNKPKVDFSEFIKKFDAYKDEDNKENVDSREYNEHDKNQNNSNNYFAKKYRISRFIDKEYIKEYKTHIKDNNKQKEFTTNCITENKNNLNNEKFIKNNFNNRLIINFKKYPININAAQEPFTFSYRKLDQNLNNNSNFLNEFDFHKKNGNDVSEFTENNFKFANQTLYRDKENFLVKPINDLKIIQNIFDNQDINHESHTQKEKYKENIKKQSEEFVGSLSFEKFIKKSHSLSSLIASSKKSDKNIFNHLCKNEGEIINSNNKNEKDSISINYRPENFQKIEFEHKFSNSKKFSKELKGKINKTLGDVQEFPHSDLNKNGIGKYMERRHRQEIERLNKIKIEIFELEQKNIKQKPKISKNYKKIIKKPKLEKSSVFERLTDNHQFLKKEEEIKILDNIYNKNPCSFEPEINLVSKLQKRDVNDLYNWMKRRETKRLRKEIDANKKINMKILPNSEEILKEVSPDYLLKKVEDRLIEKGKL